MPKLNKERLYDFAPISYVSLDSAGRILEANQKAAAMIGIESLRLKGMYLSQFMAKGDWQRFLRLLRKSRDSSEPKSIELKLKVADRRTIQAEILVGAFQPRDTTRVWYRAAIADRTERSQAAEALRQANDEFEARVAEKTLELSNKVDYLKAAVLQHELAEAAAKAV